MVNELASLTALAPASERECTCGLVWLEGLRVSPSCFGWKAANLCLDESVYRHIPPGFALSRALVARIAGAKVTQTDLADLRSAWSRLIALSKSKTLIVRTSSRVEEPGETSFAGLFCTVRNVRSFTQLIAAIRRCHSSGKSPTVNAYARLRDIAVPPNHVGVLVQTQVPINQSAVIHIACDAAFVEGYDGDLEPPIRGVGSPNHVVSFQGNKSKTLYFERPLSPPFLAAIADLITDLQITLRATAEVGFLVLEVSTDNENLFVLQLNRTVRVPEPLRKATTWSLNLRTTALAGRLSLLGLKGAAMSYFGERRLFNLPLRVFPSSTDISSIGRDLVSFENCAEGYTIRFSHDRDLGLPRSFQRKRKDAMRWLTAIRKREWSTIFHPYIDVRRSFELLLSIESALLEQVPGIWESDSSLAPDVLVLEGRRAKAWRVTSTRRGRLAGIEGSQDEAFSPVDAATIKAWADRLGPALAVLRDDFAQALPLNFHFVEDADGRWHFLNIRPGFHFEPRGVVITPPHVVQSADDILTWDGRAPLLLRFTSARGAERHVVAIAERLPRDRRFVLLVDFGLLSHPAMILLELGFNPIPTYLASGGNKWPPQHEELAWDLDKSSAIARIAREAPIHLDSKLRVVRDLTPILQDHLLVISESAVPSFADGDAHQALDALLRGDTGGLLPSHRWIYAERGRATFCTSGFPERHAHAHLLPAEHLSDDAVPAFVAHVGATQRGSLPEALAEAAKTREEYFLVVSPSGEVFLRTSPLGGEVVKRFIRTFFGGRVIL
jgi:Pyruvate phosphate dikinase, AMP/ATP-binding domain